MEKIAIFGTGLVLDNYYQMLASNYDIIYLVDNDKAKWGKLYYGKECCSPQVLADSSVDKIIILTIWERYVKEIKSQLEKMGFSECVFHINELQPIVNQKDLDGFF